MKIAMFGTGAMGTMFSAYLSRVGDVTMFTHRAAQADAIRREGIVLEKEDGAITARPEAIVSGTPAGQTFDLIVVLVKAYQTADVLEDNRRCISDGTAVLTLQNGLGNADTLARFVRRDNILVGTSTINSRRLSDTSAHQHGNVGFTNIGSISGNRALADKIGALFTEAGFNVNVTDNIEGLVWRKVFVNMTCNPMTALFDRNIKIVENETARELAGRQLAEAVAVANAMGQDFDLAEVDAYVRKVLMNSREGTTSMRTDIAAGRPTEIDFLNGAVARLGEKHGIPTPYCRMMTELIHILEARDVE